MLYKSSIPVRSTSVPQCSLPFSSAGNSCFGAPLRLSKRLVERAGGTRFIKGLKGEDFQNWRRACEGLRDSREGVESGEARLTEDVLQFEDGVRAADVAVAAHKVA